MVTSSGNTVAARAGAAFAAFRGGDLQRMDELVELLTPVLWHTARGAGLEASAAQDVVQQAWLRLIEHADGIQDPQAVMGWLLVTVRRESWRTVKVAGRADAELDEEQPAADADPADLSVLAESDGALWRQVSVLNPRCRALLRVIAFADRPDYATVARSLGMPVGSIGPTRGRCLAKLRAALLADPEWVV
jgi:RNA polymerase sigma factor (sigma-70 family)